MKVNLNIFLLKSRACLCECFYTAVDMLTLHPAPQDTWSNARQTVYVSPLCHNPFSSPSLHFLGWTKHIVLTHHCLIMLELTGTPELPSTGLPWGFFFTPYWHCTIMGQGSTNQPLIFNPNHIFLNINNTLQRCYMWAMDLFECCIINNLSRFPWK